MTYEGCCADPLRSPRLSGPGATPRNWIVSAYLKDYEKLRAELDKCEVGGEEWLSKVASKQRCWHWCLEWPLLPFHSPSDISGGQVCNGPPT